MAGEAVEGVAAAAVVAAGEAVFGAFGFLPTVTADAGVDADGAADTVGVGSLAGADAVTASVADGGDSTCVSGGGADAEEAALGSF